MLLQHLHVHAQLIDRGPESLIIDSESVIVRFEFVTFLQDHSQLLFYPMQTHHPFLIHHRSVDVDRDLERHLVWNLYFPLYYFLHRIVHVYGFVDVDRLVDIHRFVNMDVDRFFDDFRGTGKFDLKGHFPLHFYDLLYNFLHNSFRTGNVLGNFDSHLYWLLNNDLSYSLFGHSSILILELLFQNRHFHL